MVMRDGSSRPGRLLVPVWLVAVAVGIIALGLCLWRLMPGVGFWDTAEFQTVLPVMGTAHPTGYPTYVLVGWLASVVLQPLGEPALRVNVLSAILVAIGAGMTVDLVRRLSGSVLVGIAAGLGIAVTPIVWAIGTHADPHALHFAFVAIILWLLVRWEQVLRGDPFADRTGPAAPDQVHDTRHADRLLLAAAVVAGLSVGNHSLTLLLGPPIILFVLAVDPGILRRRRFIAANVAAFAIPTVLVRFEMILRAGWFRAPFVYADPSTWSGFWYVTLGAQFHGWLTDPFSNAAQRIAALIAIAVDQFGPLTALIVVAFAVTVIRRPRYALLSGTIVALTCFFNSVYPDGAIDRYYIGPALIAWTWLAILGASVVDVATGGDPAGRRRVGDDGPGSGATGRRRARSPREALRPVGFVVVAALLLAPSLISFSDRAGSADIDETGNRAAQAWTDGVLGALEPDAVVVSWWSYSTPLWSATIVDARRPDICIIDDRNRLDDNLGDLDQVIDRYIATRPVYLIRNGSSELGALAGRYTIEQLAAGPASNVLQVAATPAHGGPVAPPPGSSEPCR
jgi:hypothetical protein